MRRVDPSDWQPAGIGQLEDNAWDAVRHEGSSCVVAGPGAGKTEFLAQRADYLLSTGLCPHPCSILAISFKRDAARNLADRVGARTPDSARRFESLTFDAFTKGLVDRFRAALPEHWRTSADYEVWSPGPKYAEAFLDDLAAQRPDRAEEIAALPRRTFSAEVVGTHPLPITVTDAGTAREEASLAWWDRHYLSAEQPRVDFVMLNRLAELIVRANPAIRRALLLTYPHVFIDEFQDTTFAQYSFLRSVFGAGPTVLTAVGDDKQRIMGWAGAISDAFSRFEDDFSAQRFELTWNFRSSPAMTKLHHVVAGDLDASARPAESQVAAAGDNPSQIWLFDDARTEARCIAQWISADTESSGRSPDRYVLLARQQPADLQPLIEEELARFGIPLRNDNEQFGALVLQDLLADELALRILDFVRLGSAQGGNGAAWTAVASLASRMHDRSRHEEETVPRSHRALEEFVASLRRWMSDNPPDAAAIGRAVDAVVSYLGEQAIRSAFPAHRQQDFLDKTITALKERLADVADGDNRWDLLCDRAAGRGAVPLMTVHKSKGLEYHTVIFLALDDGQWWSIKNDPTEAVRTFFVGLSRAEQRTIFTYCKERGGLRRLVKPLYDYLDAADVAEVRPQPFSE